MKHKKVEHDVRLRFLGMILNSFHPPCYCRANLRILRGLHWWHFFYSQSLFIMECSKWQWSKSILSNIKTQCAMCTRHGWITPLTGSAFGQRTLGAGFESWWRPRLILSTGMKMLQFGVWYPWVRLNSFMPHLTKVYKLIPVKCEKDTVGTKCAVW